MAKRRAGTRVRRPAARGAETKRRNGSPARGVNVSVVPRVLVGAVNELGTVAVSTLQFAGGVLRSAATGAATLGAEAFDVTMAAARDVVSATSQMMGGIAATAESTFRQALNGARQSRPGAARAARRRPPAAVNGKRDDATPPAPSAVAPPSRRRSRRQRQASGALLAAD